MAPSGSNSEDGNTSSSRSSSERKVVKKKAKREAAALRWCFTWNNPGKAPGFQESLQKICKKFIYQREIGEEGTEHFQGAIWLKKKGRMSALKSIDAAIHWEKMRNETASENYCQKFETSTGEVVKYGFPAEIETLKVLRCWQDELYDILSFKPDTRKIYWIIDEDGNSGKTEFVRYYALKHKKVAICANAGNGKDVANLLKNFAETNDIGLFRVFLYNMARSSKISYNMIECMKDGMMTNTKYEANTLIFNRPHVVVMSNEEPEFDKLSADRWVVYKIENGELQEYEVVDEGGIGVRAT